MSMLNNAVIVRYIGQDHSFLSVISYSSQDHYREIYDDIVKNVMGKPDIIVFVSKSDESGFVNFVDILNDICLEFVTVNMNVRDLLSL